jgi:hypothetical protein
MFPPKSAAAWAQPRHAPTRRSRSSKFTTHQSGSEGSGVRLSGGFERKLLGKVAWWRQLAGCVPARRATLSTHNSSSLTWQAASLSPPQPTSPIFPHALTPPRPLAPPLTPGCPPFTPPKPQRYIGDVTLDLATKKVTAAKPVLLGGDNSTSPWPQVNGLHVMLSAIRPPSSPTHHQVGAAVDASTGPRHRPPVLHPRGGSRSLFHFCHCRGGPALI